MTIQEWVYTLDFPKYGIFVSSYHQWSSSTLFLCLNTELSMSQSQNVLLLQDLWTTRRNTYMHCDGWTYEVLPILPCKTPEKMVLLFKNFCVYVILHPVIRGQGKGWVRERLSLSEPSRSVWPRCRPNWKTTETSEYQCWGGRGLYSV